MEKYYDKYWKVNRWRYVILDENCNEIRTTKNEDEVSGLVRVMDEWNPVLALHENNIHVYGKWYIPGQFIKRRSVVESVCRSVCK